MPELSITAADAGKRLDFCLGEHPEVASRSQAVRLIESGAVNLNGQVIASKRQMLAEGDTLSFTLPEKTSQRPSMSSECPKAQVATSAYLGFGPLPEFIALDIRFEDDELIVLSKQAGLVCHPSRGHETGTLVNALVAHCGLDHLARLQGDERPGIVHRLDKDTSGLMVVAKTDVTGQALQDAIRLRSLDRRYLALVHGYVAADSGLIDAPLIRGFKDRTRYVVSDEPGARGAVTSFLVLERFEAGKNDDGYSLLECKLFSGRTHQIRVHMAYTQHPVVGDPLYGSSRRNLSELGLSRQFLHSYSLDFVHPQTGEELSFRDRLPDELLAALADIQGESMGLTAAGVERSEYFTDSAAGTERSEYFTDSAAAAAVAQSDGYFTKTAKRDAEKDEGFQ